MKRPSLFTLCLSLLLLLPSAVMADTITDVTISPPPIMKLSEESPQPGAVVWIYAGTRGTQYDVEISVDSEPLGVVVTGAQLLNTGGQAWSYDSNTNKVTFQISFTGFLPGTADFQGVDPFSVGLVWSTGPDGAPTQMQGFWMDVNVLVWGLIPPELNDPAFGYTLSGPAGQTGRFRGFIPSAIITLLAQLGGDSSYSAADLAVFDGNSQASLAITEVTSPDGMLIDLNVPFSTAVDLQTPPPAPARLAEAVGIKSISKNIKVKEAKPLSLAAKVSPVKRGKKATLFGFPKGGTAGLKVTLEQKVGSKWIKVKSAKTNSAGKFTFAPKLLATTSYRAYATINSAKVKSSAVKVRAK